MYSPVDHRLAQLMAEAAQATGGDAPVPFRFSLPASGPDVVEVAPPTPSKPAGFPPTVEQGLHRGLQACFKPARTAEDEEKETHAKRSIMHIN